MYEIEFLEACRRNPLIKTNKPNPSIEEILLSKTAISPMILPDNVKTAFKELIELNYFFINRILEVCAYRCLFQGLFIYFADPSEIKSFKLNPAKQGHFDPNYNLIVIATKLPFSQVLMHELTHAVRHFIAIGKSDSFLKHENFCKSQFPYFFKKAIKNPGITPEENQILTYIKNDFHNLSAFGFEILKKSSETEWNKKISSLNECKKSFSTRCEEIEKKERFRRSFYSAFNQYEEHEFAEEFLPFFLQYFVKAVYQEKIIPLEPNITSKIYPALVLEFLWSALPENIVANFVKDDFRSAIKNFVLEFVKPCFFHNNICCLIDGEFYSISTSEPLSINNHISYGIK